MIPLLRAIVACLLLLGAVPLWAAPAPPRWRLTYELTTSASAGKAGTFVVVPMQHEEPESGQAGEYAFRLTCEVEFHLEPGSHPSNPDEVVDRFAWSAEVGGLATWVGPSGEERRTGAGSGGTASGVLTDVTAEQLGLSVVLGEKDPRTGRTDLTVSIGPVDPGLRRRMVLRYALSPVDVRIVRPEGARAYTESYLQPTRTFTAWMNVWGTTVDGFMEGTRVSAEGEEPVTAGTVRMQVASAAPRDAFTIRGEVVHRLAVPSQDGAPAFAHLAAGKGVIPASGQPSVEAWLVPPEPSGAPVASTRARDGRFQLSVPLEKGRSIRLKTTWYSQEAQIEEHGFVEVSCDAILQARRSARGSAWSVPIAAERKGKVYARWEGQPRERDLGTEPRGAVLRQDGLEFRGNNALTVHTLLLQAPYLNQNSHTTTVSVLVPKARLQHNLPPWFTEAEKAEVLGRLPAGERMDVRVQGYVVCFPTCVSMVLGCLGADSGDGLVQKTMQGVYDLYLQTEGPRDAVWGWPFEFPLPNVAKSLEGLVAAGIPLETAVTTVQGYFPPEAFAKWPFRPKDETYRGNNVLWLATIPGTLRPWQIVDPTNRYLQPTYGLGTSFREGDVFGADAPAALSSLGRGRPAIVSIRHREADGGEGGHILVLLGAVVDMAGQPVRLLLHDPYGDQTRTPSLEGYYGATSDVDRAGGGWGAYVPYGPDVKSYAGTLAGKYWCAYTPADEKALSPGQWPSVLPARVRKRLLPSD